MKAIFCAIAIMSFISCKQETRDDNPVKDVHSFAEPSTAVVTHLDLDIKVDFDSQQISGKASWTIDNLAGKDTIVFDTRQLKIEKVTLGNDEKPATFGLSHDLGVMGQPMQVVINNNTTRVHIYYKTTRESAALQWLQPQQTAGKKYRFLFTQSQAILARTWIPCQDSPGIRFTYNAKVSVTDSLLALMSAENPRGRSGNGTYEFRQIHPVPSYLMALAVGDIHFKDIDQRTGVYAEPVMVEKAAWEFADMGKMVAAAEKLYGPYRWGRYDLLVLPPSFPFGGMENPMLTFATPTAIAGDRSLVSLVAHELAHSWSGNLVTNATWNDFWLNEGFTTYFERRIVEAVYGKEEKEMQEVLGLQDLKDEIQAMGETNPDTRLKLDLTGRDPDLGVTSIAYEKGYLFLRHLEDVAGRPALDSFLIKYFDSHAFRSITTEQFLAYLDENLLKSHPSLKEKLDIETWVYKPGLPKDIPVIRSSRFVAIDSMSSNNNTKSLASPEEKKLSTNEILYFLRRLPEQTSVADMELLDRQSGFTHSGNAEIQSVWYALAVKHHYKPAYAETEQFLINVGRRKFLLPIYRELVKTSEGKEWAKRIYAKARPNYHSVAYNSIDAMLK